MGADRLAAKLAKYPEKINRTVESVLAQEARSLCIEYAKETQPWGMEESKGDSFRGRINEEVRRVYASRQDPFKVYEVLKQHAPQLAAAYWHAYKAGKTRRMGQILTAANLPQGINPAALKAARGPNGRVRKGTKAVSVATEAQVRARVRMQQKLVFTAKAGWYVAARALGGRVRQTIAAEDSATGRRNSVEIFPKSARRLARQFGAALGGARRRPGWIEVYSSVRHADKALSSTAYERATDKGMARFRRSLVRSLRKLNERHWGGRRAA